MTTSQTTTNYISLADYYKSERTALERLIDESFHQQTFAIRKTVIHNGHDWNKKDYQNQLGNSMIAEIMRDVEKVFRDNGSFVFNRSDDPMDEFSTQLSCQIDIAWVNRPRKVKEEIKEAIKELTDYDEDV